jgi:hypothetical protein
MEGWPHNWPMVATDCAAKPCENVLRTAGRPANSPWLTGHRFQTSRQLYQPSDDLTQFLVFKLLRL